MSANSGFVLELQCADRLGIVAAVSQYLADARCNITESAQHQEPESSTFYMRTAFSCEDPQDGQALREGFQSIADMFGMRWSINSLSDPMRTVLAVSKWGHCLDALIAGSKRGSIPIHVAAVVSNHPDLSSLCEWYGVPFVHLPVTPETRREQEARILETIAAENAELLVLARYMQILSNKMCLALEGRAINIHHSFLPGFKGAKPYHQAYEKGVKLIGATAHYVTADLDEGPIIEQETVRVSHADSAQDLVETGRNIEASVLCRAVKWHAEKRVLLAGSRTVVFDR